MKDGLMKSMAFKLVFFLYNISTIRENKPWKEKIKRNYLGIQRKHLKLLKSNRGREFRSHTQ